MPILTLEQRKLEIDSFIDNKTFEDDKLVYSFVLHLYSNKEIDECIDYVKKLCTLNHEKNLVYYKLWYISLLYLRGYFEKAKQEFSIIQIKNIFIILKHARVMALFKRVNTIEIGMSQRTFIITCMGWRDRKHLFWKG